MLVARAVHQPVRQVTPEYGIEHPKVYPHARVGWIGRGPVRRTAAGWAVPKIERAIALLIRDARIHHGHGIGGAIMPEPGSALAYRAVTLGGLDRHVAQNELNSPAMAASVVLAHPRGLLAIVKLGQRIVARDPNARKSSPHFLMPLCGSRVHRRGDPLAAVQRSRRAARNRPHSALPTADQPRLWSTNSPFSSARFSCQGSAI